MRARLAQEWAAFLLAAQFLTRLPLARDVGFTPARLAASPRYYPAVGVLVGAIAAAAYALAALAFPPTLAALASTAAGLLVTGCLHEDGFADACDGLGGGGTPARALEIMRDSRIGTYGAAGLGLMLAAKILALAALPPAAVPAVLIAGHAASRASAVLVMATSTYLRDHGAGRPVAKVGAPGLGVALAIAGAAMLALGFVLPLLAVIGGCVGLGLGHWTMRARFQRRLGGYTGDCLGAVQQTSELGLYLGLLAWL